MSYSKISSLSVACLFGAIACAKSEPERPMTPAASWTPTEIAPPAAPTTLSEPRTQSAPAAQQADRSAIADPARSSTLIATARCEREVRCKNVGGEGKYVTQEDCVVSLEPATRSELDARDCPKGVSEVELTECTEEIKQTGCDSPVQNIDLVTECSNEELCVD